MNKAITHGLIAGLAIVSIGCSDNRHAHEETGELRFRALLGLSSRGETGNTCNYPTDLLSVFGLSRYRRTKRGTTTPTGHKRSSKIAV